ncbi:MAG: 2-oxoacid:acceptor oxidoreductase subunit alpha, partial [Bdellovibrionaceae bacterium]|nr:2-oxoacid:acceptor oxidoreductase subunit alpha [Pseudobdellovibrionaceae bacterium]
IRVNKDGYTARREDVDIVVAMNPQTVLDDMKKVKPGGVFLYNTELKVDASLLRSDIRNIGVNFRELVDQSTDAIKLKKLLVNMIYVGILGELLRIDWDVLVSTIQDQFNDKPKVLESNFKALEVGRKYAMEHLLKDLQGQFPFTVERMNRNSGKVLIDGNTAAAIGMIFGGCTFVSWYPITPSSSLAEAYISLAEQYRKDANGKNTFAVVQAEDELAAITMVAGAAWAGARAMTCTSGPGVSLMGEAAGLFYYAELPGVIWDIQRVGPSTGMPTRTAQGDLMSAYTLSHGDTKHIVLLPGTVEECFEFGMSAFDVAERMQTLVFVLSDLDLGMNFWIGDEFQYPDKPFDRGKVLDADALAKLPRYSRYEDVDGDAIGWRTLPGTHNEKAGFLTRGSGHNKHAQYTESSPQYQEVVDRLVKKWNTAKKYVPQPIVDHVPGAKIGVLAYGSTNMPMREARDILKKHGLANSYLRVRALPLTDEVESFIAAHDRVYVIEQNRDGQMLDILRMEFFTHSQKLKSVRHYDGMPITAPHIANPILTMEGIRTGSLEGALK